MLARTDSGCTTRKRQRDGHPSLLRTLAAAHPCFGKHAAWPIDTDYDERSLSRAPSPLTAGQSQSRLIQASKKDIRAELNEDLSSNFHRPRSQPSEAGSDRVIAAIVVVDREIESLKVVTLE